MGTISIVRALDLFDRLRLREPLGQAFQALGLEGEHGWRAAARIKVLLLIESGVGKPGKTETPPPVAAPSNKVAPAADALVAQAPESMIPADLWADPDVRWLTGFNQAEGHAYVVREAYEELLWWLSLPQLLNLAGRAVPTRAAAAVISKNIAESVAAVEKAGYRVDVLIEGETKEAGNSKVQETTDRSGN